MCFLILLNQLNHEHIIDPCAFSKNQTYEFFLDLH